MPLVAAVGSVLVFCSPTMTVEAVASFTLNRARKNRRLPEVRLNDAGTFWTSQISAFAAELVIRSQPPSPAARAWVVEPVAVTVQSAATYWSKSWLYSWKRVGSGLIMSANRLTSLTLVIPFGNRVFEMLPIVASKACGTMLRARLYQRAGGFGEGVRTHF